MSTSKIEPSRRILKIICNWKPYWYEVFEIKKNAHGRWLAENQGGGRLVTRIKIGVCWRTDLPYSLLSVLG